jgi:phosphoglycolate phosphatase-like HAD superfamily hydrolase
MIIFDFDQTLVDTSPVKALRAAGNWRAVMARAGAKANETFHIGDQPEDTEASRAAAVTALGAAWGLEDDSLLVASKPDQIFDSVKKLSKFFDAAI